MDFERTLKTHILECSENFPVVLVTGARQVGKTTLLRSLCEPDRRYISLDDPLALALAKEDPALFLERNPAPLLIDEVQYAPELLTHIKIRVDAEGGAQGNAAYWLTGSQPFHLMRGVAESLAGRVAVITMLGLSRQEMIGQGAALIPPFVPAASVLQARQALHQSAPWTHDQLFAHIWRGSYPALARNARLNRDVFYSSYLQTYIQRDVRALAQVGSEVVFTRFVRAAAARTAQLLNVADLARDTDIHPATAKQWLSIVQASGIVHLLQPWHSNTTKRLVKTPKLYFLDTSKGPKGSWGKPLKAHLSIAVDPKSIPLGLPLWLSSEGSTRFQQLVLSEDTGNAINGSVRADYFAGTGAQAGEFANKIKQNLKLWVLLPRNATP